MGYINSDTRKVLRRAAEQFGTPCYVYLVDQIRERISEIDRAFGGRFEISYAVKANPNAALLRELRSLVGGLDVSSGGELQLGLDAGYCPDRLSFSGPGKSIDEVERAVESGCQLIAESEKEVAEADEIAKLHTTGPSTSCPIRLIASKSPGELKANPASMISTFRRASCLATRTFSSIFMLAPGDCSPSRNVVSKILMSRAITDAPMMKKAFFPYRDEGC